MTDSALINQKRLTDTFVELIKINSPSFSEKVIAGVLARKLSAIGFSVRLQPYDQSINLIAHKKGKKRTLPILLSAHMDTIEPTLGIIFVVDKDRVR